jgi:D-glycero-D-manno-heptose 1,7-bisphosphate phosphatase
VPRGFQGAVFLDRDGTLAPDVRYCRRIQDFHLFPDAAEAVRLVNRYGLPVIVVTNQSGIARGYFDVQTLNSIHDYMCSEISRHEGRIDAVYYCPHHPDEGCFCRKPRPGMLLQASRELGINLSSSFLVGDLESDAAAAHAAGCRAVLLETVSPDGDLRREPAERTSQADFRARSLLEAVEWIIEVSRNAVPS